MKTKPIDFERDLLDNIHYLASQNARIRLRCPIIPGLNDIDEHFEGISLVAESIPNLDGVDLMPYHDTGRYKNKEIDREICISASVPATGDADAWRKRLADFGNHPCIN